MDKDKFADRAAHGELHQTCGECKFFSMMNNIIVHSTSGLCKLNPQWVPHTALDWCGKFELHPRSPGFEGTKVDPEDGPTALPLMRDHITDGEVK